MERYIDLQWVEKLFITDHLLFQRFFLLDKGILYYGKNSSDVSMLIFILSIKKIQSNWAKLSLSIAYITLCVSGNFCCLLITFVNILDPDPGTDSVFSLAGSKRLNYLQLF